MKLKRMRRLVVLQILGSLALLPVALAANPSSTKAYFTAAPYVNLGYHFKGNNLTVVWLSEDGKTDDLDCEYKKYDAPAWNKANITKQSLNGHPELNVFSAELSNLPADTIITYKISKAKKDIFQASTQSLPSPGSPVNFSVFGDVGEGSAAESEVAQWMKKKEPAMEIIVGDIVYPIGNVRNYLRNFFPFLNSEGGKDKGVPLLRSTLTVAAAGNHDLTYTGGIDARDLDLSGDSMAYYTLWKQPLNGPLSANGENIAQPRGSKEKVADFLKAAGEAYPRMTNFSFDYGDCHVLILDGCEYVDWTDDKLRKWVDNDLSQAKTRWKIVAYHQPGFNSDWAHREEQRMRHLADIFEKDGVDICFAGHSHSYQRSYPLHFKEVGAPTSDREARAGYVYGTFKIDKSFDGVKNCKPDGVVYIVTGAAGAGLSGGDLELQPGQWLPFTSTFSSKHHSFTFCHLDNNKFALEQIAEDGTIVDHFSIVK